MENQELKNATASTRKRALNVAEILRGTEYALTLFTAEEVAAIDIFDKGGKPYLSCEITNRARPAKPEEIVRQLFIRRLTNEYGYPKERIALEKRVYFGSAVHEKAADIVVWEQGPRVARVGLGCRSYGSVILPANEKQATHCFIGGQVGESKTKLFDANFIACRRRHQRRQNSLTRGDKMAKRGSRADCLGNVPSAVALLRKREGRWQTSGRKRSLIRLLFAIFELLKIPA